MRTINFYDYVSKRYATNDTRESRVRELVYAFKSGQREAKHNNANHIVSESYGYLVSADPEFFANKNVILFDDLITTGETANEFAAELESVGANVLGAMFLARTKMMNN